MNNGLLIESIRVSVAGIQILKELHLQVAPGTVHAIMGANGSGKSTLAYTLIGHPNYCIEQGTIFYQGHDITTMSPDKRAKLGIFLAFQHPYALPGVTVFTFLKESHYAITGLAMDIADFKALLYATMDLLVIDRAFAMRAVNEGFSGGEKKRFEMLQLLILKPSLVILDELDSGLDIDALKVVMQALRKAKQENPSMSIMYITHYQKIFSHMQPDFVHVLSNGAIVKTGSITLADEIAHKGYDGYRI